MKTIHEVSKEEIEAQNANQKDKISPDSSDYAEVNVSDNRDENDNARDKKGYDDDFHFFPNYINHIEFEVEGKMICINLIQKIY
jgi:hypothetical protein